MGVLYGLLRLIKGDTKSLDNDSHRLLVPKYPRLLKGTPVFQWLPPLSEILSR